MKQVPKDEESTRSFQAFSVVLSSNVIVNAMRTSHHRKLFLFNIYDNSHGRIFRNLIFSCNILFCFVLDMLGSSQGNFLNWMRRILDHQQNT